MLRRLSQYLVLDCRAMFSVHRHLASKAAASKATKSRKGASAAQKVEEAKPQIVLHADAEDSETDLLELAHFLNRSFQRGKINSAIDPGFGKTSLLTQLEKTDQENIEYTVVLRNSTLKDGFLGLRQIHSTIQEQVHVSVLKRYLRFIFRP